ncbi:hypothetical protein EYF80_059305 [Liparis tanakae]|uniref:Uncharacterized protein n=1 Tax=Liparis tanakae TaxID=230148 RepID=A0A4Z2EP22_9TELE|nr:hypothetical protein EYF80_059305 [Liparis tanakae]
MFSSGCCCVARITAALNLCLSTASSPRASCLLQAECV